MIITEQQSEALLALDAYAISIHSRMDPAKGEDAPPWAGRELTLTVTISGFGTTQASSTPTWAATAGGQTIEEAFARALLYAPTQLADCNARAAGNLASILPEYDPEGKRKTKRPSSLNRLDPTDALAALGLI